MTDWWKFITSLKEPRLEHQTTANASHSCEKIYHLLNCVWQNKYWECRWQSSHSVMMASYVQRLKKCFLWKSEMIEGGVFFSLFKVNPCLKFGVLLNLKLRNDSVLLRHGAHDLRPERFFILFNCIYIGSIYIEKIHTPAKVLKTKLQIDESK